MHVWQKSAGKKSNMLKSNSRGFSQMTSFSWHAQRSFNLEKITRQNLTYLLVLLLTVYDLITTVPRAPIGRFFHSRLPIGRRGCQSLQMPVQRKCGRKFIARNFIIQKYYFHLKMFPRVPQAPHRLKMAAFTAPIHECCLHRSHANYSQSNLMYIHSI